HPATRAAVESAGDGEQPCAERPGHGALRMTPNKALQRRPRSWFLTVHCRSARPPLLSYAFGSEENGTSRRGSCFSRTGQLLHLHGSLRPRERGKHVLGPRRGCVVPAT